MSIYLISIYEQSLSASPRRSSTVGKGHQLDCEEAPTNFGHLIFSLPNFISYSSETPSPLLLMLIRATENPSDRASVYQGMPLAAPGYLQPGTCSGRTGPNTQSQPYAVLCLNHKTVLSPL